MGNKVKHKSRSIERHAEQHNRKKKSQKRSASASEDSSVQRNSCGKEKKVKSRRKKRRRSSSGASVSSSSSSSTSDSDSSQSSSSSSSSGNSERRRKRRKRKKKLAKKLLKREEKKRKDEKRKLKKIKEKLKVAAKDIVESGAQEVPRDRLLNDINLELADRARAMAPMTKEQWEKKQSVIRRVYDEETGRQRLIKGDGEVLEEIVSRDRHMAINKKATKGDGEYFQARLSVNK